MNIVRIISLKELTNFIFPKNGEGSTFLLRDPLSYRNVLLKNNGDPCEQETKGKSFTATTTNNFLVSCWSLLESINDLKKFFQFPEYNGRNDIAVVSTVDAIERILKNKFLEEIEFIQEFIHKKVDYYKYENQNKPDEQSMPDYCLDAPFRKPEEYNGLDYKKQKEYRFAWRLSSKLSIEKFALYVNPKEYIKCIYVNPQRSLRRIIQTGLITWDINIDTLKELTN